MKCRKIATGRYKFGDYILVNTGYKKVFRSICWMAISIATGMAKYQAKSKKDLIIKINLDNEKEYTIKIKKTTI